MSTCAESTLRGLIGLNIPSPAVVLISSRLFRLKRTYPLNLHHRSSIKVLESHSLPISTHQTRIADLPFTRLFSNPRFPNTNFRYTSVPFCLIVHPPLAEDRPFLLLLFQDVYISLLV